MFEAWDYDSGLGLNPADVQVKSGAEYAGSNAGPGGIPPSKPLVYQCTPEYVTKYRAIYGVAPAFCGKPIPPEAIGTIYPETQTRPIPTYILPPTTRGPGAGQTYRPPVTTPTATTGPAMCSYAPPPEGMHYAQGPNYDPRSNCGMVLTRDTPEVQPAPTPTPPTGVSPGPLLRPRRRRPVRALPAPVQPTGEVCPHYGYVTRPLPGTSEYGVFPCRRGQPVVIDPARMASLTADAKARGLSDLDEILTFVQQPTLGLPMWAWLVAAVAIFMVIKRGRR